MIRTTFFQELAQCKTVYDIVACAYFVVCESDEVKTCTDAFSSTKRRNVLYKAYDNIFSVSQTRDSRLFSFIRGAFINLINLHTKIELGVHCALFIYAFDLNMRDDKPEGILYLGCMPAVETSGPLNKTMHINEIAVFTHVKSVILEAFEENGTQSRLRNSGEPDYCSINAILKLKHLILVQLRSLGNYAGGVSTVRYNDYGRIESILHEKKMMRVGFAPVSINEPYNIKIKENKFRIDGLKPGTEKDILKRYLKTIEEMGKDGVNIAIFPEAFLTNTILLKIKEYLKESKGTSCDLIICGSIWADHKNEVVVLTSSGEELIRNKRYAPFLLKKTPNEQYWEDIIQGNNREMAFIDVNGLGRIAVYVCKDFISLNKPAATELAVSITTVVSATGSMDEFLSDAQYIVKRNNNVVLFNNTCCELESKIKKLDETEEIEVGFAGVPFKHNNSNEVDICGYHAYKYCAEKCVNHGCYHLFTLYLGKDDVKVRAMRDIDCLKTMSMSEAKDWNKQERKDYLEFRLKRKMEHRVFKI